jgi:outer membrane protein OmpA-like peptidoglycan-associated protein
MRRSTSAVSLLCMVLLIAACAAGCAKKKVQLEMTRETVILDPVIESMSIDPSGRLDTRDSGKAIQVTLVGDPGLQATFDIEGGATGQPMRETEPGVYRGSFNVAKGQKGELRLVGHLVDPPSGASQTHQSRAPLALWVSAPMGCTPEMVREFDAKLRNAIVMFGFDAWELDAANKAKVAQDKKIFDAYPLCPVFILGYSDDVGRPEYNMTLSQRRAALTRSYVLSLGIPDSRVREFFFGEEFAVDSTDSPEARAKNRRVEFRAFNPHKRRWIDADGPAEAR